MVDLQKYLIRGDLKGFRYDISKKFGELENKLQKIKEVSAAINLNTQNFGLITKNIKEAKSMLGRGLTMEYATELFRKYNYTESLFSQITPIIYESYEYDEDSHPRDENSDLLSRLRQCEAKVACVSDKRERSRRNDELARSTSRNTALEARVQDYISRVSQLESAEKKIINELDEKRQELNDLKVNCDTARSAAAQRYNNLQTELIDARKKLIPLELRLTSENKRITTALSGKESELKQEATTKLETFKKLTAETRLYEKQANDYYKKYTGMKDEYDKIKGRVINTINENKQLNRDNKDLTLERDNLDRMADLYKTEIEIKKQELKDCSDKIKELDSLRTQITKLEFSLNKATSDLSRMQNSSVNLQNKLNDMQGINARLRTISSELSTVRAELKDCQSKNADLTSQMGLQSAELKMAQTDLLKTRTDLGATRANNIDTKKLLGDSTNLIDKYKQDLTQQSAELAQKNNEIKILEHDLQQKDMELNQKVTELAQKETELNQKATELAQKETEIEQKDADLTQKETEHKNFLDKLNKQSPEEIKMDVAQIIQQNINSEIKEMDEVEDSLQSLEQNIRNFKLNLIDTPENMIRYIKKELKNLVKLAWPYSKHKPENIDNKSCVTLESCYIFIDGLTQRRSFPFNRRWLSKKIYGKFYELIESQWLILVRILDHLVITTNNITGEDMKQSVLLNDALVDIQNIKNNIAGLKVEIKDRRRKSVMGSLMNQIMLKISNLRSELSGIKTDGSVRDKAAAINAQQKINDDINHLDKALSAFGRGQNIDYADLNTRFPDINIPRELFSPISVGGSATTRRITTNSTESTAGIIGGTACLVSCHIKLILIIVCIILIFYLLFMTYRESTWVISKYDRWY